MLALKVPDMPGCQAIARHACDTWSPIIRLQLLPAVVLPPPQLLPHSHSRVRPPLLHLSLPQ